MKFNLLSERDMKAMDALKALHGGAAKINETIEFRSKLENRKVILAEKGHGYSEMIADAEELVKKFPKQPAYEVNNAYGTARSQVSGFQGAKVTHNYMKRVVENAETNPVFVPVEMISVVPLTDQYVFSGDLMATLAMTENIMGTSKYCTTHLIGTPQPEARFLELEATTGERFERTKVDEVNSALILKNQGTFFGNFGGIEVANSNHLVYLDGVTRTALESGGDFYLNPSWSTIVASCYYAKDIPNLTFKVSMLLSTQTTIHFRLLLNIISEYIREDGTTPIYEINIGNGADSDTFIQCEKELKESGIKGVTLAAHMRINPDLGIEGFNWTENAHKVLESGANLTYKYESDGNARDMDTMAAYFMSDADRDENAEKIGEVIYYKALKATQDGKDFMKKGIKTLFGKAAL